LVFTNALKNSVRLVVYKEKIVDQAVPFLQMAYQLLFGICVLQDLFSLTLINTAVDILK
jgi:hypothetical protein